MPGVALLPPMPSLACCRAWASAMMSGGKTRARSSWAAWRIESGSTIRASALAACRASAEMLTLVLEAGAASLVASRLPALAALYCVVAVLIREIFP